jgi:hypothetical protein
VLLVVTDPPNTIEPPPGRLPVLVAVPPLALAPAVFGAPLAAGIVLVGPIPPLVAEPPLEVPPSLGGVTGVPPEPTPEATPAAASAPLPCHALELPPVSAGAVPSERLQPDTPHPIRVSKSQPILD